MKYLVRGLLLVMAVELLLSCGGGVNCDTTTPAGVNAKTKFAYVANSFTPDSTISVYSIDGATGVWRHVSYVPATDAEPYGIAVHPNDKYVYVSSNAAGTLSAYSINAATGALSFINSAASDANSQSVTINAAGTFAFVANRNIGATGTVSSFHIDANTGAVARVATRGVGNEPHSVALTRDGNFLYTANFLSNDIGIVPINTTTGTLGATTIVPVGAGTNPNYLVLHPSGNFAYTANWGTGTVSAFSVNTTTGALTPLGTPVSTGGANPAVLAVDPSGTRLYVTNYTGQSIAAFNINTSAGTLTAIAGSPFATASLPHDIDVDASGKFVNVSSVGENTIHTYAIDAASGALAELNNRSVVSTRYIPIMFAVSHGVTTVTPTPKFAYTANGATNDVSAFSIGAGGTLTKINCVSGAGVVCDSLSGTNYSAGDHPNFIAADVFNRFVFTANNLGNSVSAYTIGTDGMLGLINTYTVLPTPSLPNSIVTEASGRIAYVANSGTDDITAYLIDSTGLLSTINCIAGGGVVCNGNNYVAGSYPQGMKVDPTGRFAFVVNNAGNDVTAYFVNVVNGRLIRVDCVAGGGVVCNGTNYTAGTQPTSITVDASGRFAYVTNSGSNDITAYSIGLVGSLIRIDCASVTGAVCSTAIPANFAAGTFPSSVVSESRADHLYVTNSGSNNITAYHIDRDGGLIPVGCVQGVGVVCDGDTTIVGRNPSGISIDNSGSYLYVSNMTSADVAAFIIGADGALTNVTYSITSISSTPTSIATTGTFQ